MKTKLYLATVMAFSFLLSCLAVEPVASPEAAVRAPEFKNLSDLKLDNSWVEGPPTAADLMK